MRKIIKYVLLDIVWNRTLLSFAALLLAVTVTMLCVGDNPTKVLLSLLDVVLIVLPLASIIFSTIYYYNAAEFIELLVCQPVKRGRILLGIYTGLAVSLLAAFVVGVAAPLLVADRDPAAWLLVLAGTVLTVVFSALALLGSVIMRDKARGVGLAILAWFYFCLLYDGLVLFLLFQFSDYPLEKPAVVLGALNPVDLSRIIVLLRVDSSAMMGYTGAVFKDCFGSAGGMMLGLGILSVWIAAPLFLAVRRFRHKDL